jgi:hypothetical protein
LTYAERIVVHLIRWFLPLVLVAGCDAAFDIEHVAEPEPPPVDPCGATGPVPESILLEGQLLDATNNAALSGFSVDAIPGGVAPTDGSGRFMINVATQSVPLFTTLTASGGAGYPRHVISYQRPFTSSPSVVDSKLLPDSSINGLYGGPPGNDVATALISLRDCDGNGVASAMFEVSSGAQVVYQGGANVTDGTGVAYALGIAPGTVTVTPSEGSPFSLELTPGDMAIVYLVAP